MRSGPTGPPVQPKLRGEKKENRNINFLCFFPFQNRKNEKMNSAAFSPLSPPSSFRFPPFALVAVAGWLATNQR